MTPIVTVAIPVYNGAAFLHEAIASVLNQTLLQLELLIVDDCSTEPVDAIIQSFSDPRIRFLRNQCNLGAEGNWNRCLAEARGRYLKMLPQDDAIAPDCLQQQVAVLENDVAESIALVCCAREIVDTRGRTLMVRRMLGHLPLRITPNQVLQRCLRKGTNVIGEPGGILFRSSLAHNVGPFSAEDPYVIDLDYWLRLLQLGDAYYISQPLVRFRVSERSWSVTIGRRQNHDFNNLMERVLSTPQFSANRLAIRWGRLRARLNTWLRLGLYQYLFRRGA